MGTAALLAIGLGGIAVLLLLIIKFKVNAFLALLLVSMVVGLAAGLPLATIPASDGAPEKLGIIPAIIAGVGGTLGSVAVLIALGSMLGRIIELSGGAESIATRFTKLLGPKRLAAGLTAAALVLAIPVFFDVGFIILVPIIYGFCHAAKLNPVKLGLPVAGIMLAVHVAVPPHPGVVGGAALLGADVGWLMILGILIVLPLGVLSHFVSKLMNRREYEMLPSTRELFEGSVASSGGAGAAQKTKVGAPPSAAMILTLILTPLVLIGAGTTAATILPAGHPVRDIAGFVGAPLFALLVTVVLAGFFLGVRRGWSSSELGEVFASALPPAAVIILITGAGGAFARILTESGIGGALADTLLATGLPIMLLAYVVALALRAAQGSATVAILTTAGLLAEVVTSGAYAPMQVVLIVLAIAFGSLGLSHVNDSGFWVVSRYLGLGVADGLRTWTVLTTVLSLAGFAIASALWVPLSAMG